MHKVFINQEGWVEVIWDKKIDSTNYVETATQMLDCITQIEDKNEEPIMIIDFSQIEEVTPEVVSLASSATRDLGCKKIAGYGVKPEFKVLLDTIKEKSTKADTIRDFPNRNEAVMWLLEKDSTTY